MPRAAPAVVEPEMAMLAARKRSRCQRSRRPASTRAANWRRFGLEAGTRYAYLNGNYMTDRRLATLSAEERNAVVYSTMSLEPLHLYRRVLDRRLAKDEDLRANFLVGREAMVQR